MHRIRPAGMIKPPRYRSVVPKSRPQHWLFERFKPEAETSGDGYVLYDYYKMAEIVKGLPNAYERIRFVNPYERPWTRGEVTWHRAWLPPLMEPRQAWAVPVVPQFYDTLNFYKYITKSRVFSKSEGRDRIDQYFSDAKQPSDELISSFERRLSENLACFLTSQNGEVVVSLQHALRSMFEDLFSHLFMENPEPLLRLAHTPRCESFWIRSGFKKMAKEHKVYFDEVDDVLQPFVGDGRRMLGELSFTMRDQLVSHARSLKPMRNLFDWSNTEELYAPVFTEPIDLENDVLFDPAVYKCDVDPNILWQCPGYDADTLEPYKYGVVALKDSSKLQEMIDHWRPESVAETEEIRHEFNVSTALMSLFNWLNGQAHCLGHTQYTDIESPLTSQMIITDGKEFYFAVSQLNTIAINIDVKGFVNKHTNVCCVDGPYRLYEEFDAASGAFKHNNAEDENNENAPLSDGLNPQVIKRMFQMCRNY